MFSEQVLSANLAALATAQGRVPPLGALDPQATRVGVDADTPCLEIRAGDGRWIALDPAATVSAVRHHLDAAPDAAQFVVIGAGLGDLLDALDAARPAARVVVLEPNPGVATLLLSRRDWRPWFAAGRLRLLTGPAYDGTATIGRHLDATRTIVTLTHPTLDAHRPEEVVQARAAATRLLEGADSNANARRQFAGRYLVQTLGNLPVIERESNVAALDAAFAGRPVVLVGAGPSLDRNIAALAEAQERVLIVAADTTLRPLLAAGVRPHLLVAVEPSELNARHLSGDVDTSDIWLAAEGSLHPSAFTGFAGRTFTFRVSNHEPWPWLEEAGCGRGQLRAWGSVVTSAFDLALRMQCDPIIFAGHDFAYTGDRIYCDNTIFHDEWRAHIATSGDTMAYHQQVMANKKATAVVSDVHGAPVKTSAHLVAFRDWIAEQAAAAPARTILNATEGGILQGAGISQLTLETALATCRTPRFARARLRQAHRSGLSSTHHIHERLTALATGSDEPRAREVVQRWVDFTLGTLDHESLKTALADRLASW